MLYTNGYNEINVSKGAYKLVYKDLGYKPVDDISNTDSDYDDSKSNNPLLGKSVQELKSLAKARGFEGCSNLTKDKLLELLERSESSGTGAEK